MTLEAEHTEPRRDELERLRTEIVELRASRVRLVLAADADRSAIEGDLHGSAAYKRQLLKVYLKRAMHEARNAGH